MQNKLCKLRYVCKWLNVLNIFFVEGVPNCGEVGDASTAYGVSSMKPGSRPTRSVQ